MDISGLKEVSQSDNLEVGDIIILQYRIISVFTSTQVAALIKKIIDQPYKLLDYEIIEHNWLLSYVQIKVKIIENPIPLAVIVAGIAALGVSVFVYLSFDKAYKIVNEPSPTTSKISWAFLLIAVAAVLFFVVKLWKH